MKNIMIVYLIATLGNRGHNSYKSLKQAFWNETQGKPDNMMAYKMICKSEGVVNLNITGIAITISTLSLFMSVMSDNLKQNTAEMFGFVAIVIILLILLFVLLQAWRETAYIKMNFVLNVLLRECEYNEKQHEKQYYNVLIGNNEYIVGVEKKNELG